MRIKGFAVGLSLVLLASAAHAQVKAAPKADALMAAAGAIDPLSEPQKSADAWTAAIQALDAERVHRPLKLAEAHAFHSNAVMNLGHTDDAIAEAKAALPLVDGSRQGQIVRIQLLENLATFADSKNDWTGSLEGYRQVWVLKKQIYGDQSPEAAATEGDMGLALYKLTRVEEALPGFAHGWSILEKQPAADQRRLTFGTYYAATLSRGHVAEAEALLRRLAVDARGLGATHPITAQINDQLADTLRSEGRTADALAVERGSIAALEASGGNQTVLGDANMTATIISQQLDRPAEALKYAQASAYNFGLIGQNMSKAAALAQASKASRQLGQLDQAVAQAREAVKLGEANQPVVPMAIALFQTPLVEALAAKGAYQEAYTYEKAAYEVIAKIRPMGHAQRINAEMTYGWVTALNGDAAAGLARYRPAFEQVVRNARASEIGQSRAIAGAQNVESFGEGLETAWLAKDPEFGFRISQVMVESDAGRATLATLAKLAAANPDVAKRLDQRHDLLRQRLDLDGQRVAKLSSDAAAADALTTQIAALDKQLAPIDASLARDLPGFDTLLRPEPETIAAVQARLRPGEVLLVPVTSYRGTFTFAISRERIAWGHSTVTRGQMRDLLARVRGSLLPRGTVRAGEDASRDLRVAPPAFDRQAAAAIYGAIFTAPVQALAGRAKLLSVASDDLLTTIPFTLLPTGAEARAPWLIEKVAIRAVPAIAALGRGARPSASATRDFAGIGAPARPEVPPANASELTKAIALLPPLPGAEAELKQMARVTGASGHAVVVTGTEATEARLSQPDFAHAGVVAFATHGLVAGDFDALTEPALLLAPDASRSGAAGDGLLTASEAAVLSLDADWVVLSACNTAAGDAQSAAGYSGLARAFLFAGARQVLASHWPVRDDISAQLTTETIRRANQGEDAASALRHAILTAMKSGPAATGGPALWAPYMVLAD